MLLALPIPYPHGSTTHTTSTVVLPATLELAAELALQTVDCYAPFAGRAEVICTTGLARIVRLGPAL